MKPLILILLCLPALLCAQDFQFRFEPEGIPVEIQGWRPFTPWAGGASETNPAIVDIDGDGDFDIFMGEVNGNIAFWKNSGNFQLPGYQFITNQYDSIHMQESRANPCFRDLDGDGDLDLIVGDIDSHVHYYQNIGTSQNPEYLLITNDLVPAAPPWIVGPELIDIDADGDLDLFGGADQQITFYRNIGTPQEFNFQVVTGNFSNINITNGWASPEFVDIDADGDYDFFIGERYGKIWFYRNDGTPQQYNFTYVTNNYAGIDVGDLASPEFVDIDGDGDYDLFVGREANETSRIGDVFYYENVGTPLAAQFELMARDYLQIDLDYAEPRLQIADLNGDNTPDILAGVYNVLDFLPNVGDSANPQFRLNQEGFQGISLPAITPCLVDIDDDGDLDMLCGEGAIPGPPSLSLYINEGTEQNPEFVLYDDEFVTNANFDVYIYPGVADIDGDGDYDLFIFDSDDNFYYYQNDGTPQWPHFVLISDQWQGIHLFPNMWYGFTFGDLDNDGDFDLLIGSPEQDNLYFYRNQGTAQSPQMVLETTNFLPNDYPYFYSPYLVDIDNDGDLDLFAGHGSG
ncbi:MAG: VCBS repeat-containing protein, partial [bacterium]|nr:VCBS repeat-containing protein [bacterium]